MGKPKTKICKECGQSKRLRDFEETHKGSGVYRDTCKVCRNTKRNEAYDSPVQEYIKRVYSNPSETLLQLPTKTHIRQVSDRLKWHYSSSVGRKVTQVVIGGMYFDPATGEKKIADHLAFPKYKLSGPITRLGSTDNIISDTEKLKYLGTNDDGKPSGIKKLGKKPWKLWPKGSIPPIANGGFWQWTKQAGFISKPGEAVTVSVDPKKNMVIRGEEHQLTNRPPLLKLDGPNGRVGPVLSDPVAHNIWKLEAEHRPLPDDPDDITADIQEMDEFTGNDFGEPPYIPYSDSHEHKPVRDKLITKWYSRSRSVVRERKAMLKKVR